MACHIPSLVGGQKSLPRTIISVPLPGVPWVFGLGSAIIAALGDLHGIIWLLTPRQSPSFLFLFWPITTCLEPLYIFLSFSPQTNLPWDSLFLLVPRACLSSIFYSKVSITYLYFDIWFNVFWACLFNSSLSSLVSLCISSVKDLFYHIPSRTVKDSLSGFKKSQLILSFFTI